jgi:hypothetical protein
LILPVLLVFLAGCGSPGLQEASPAEIDVAIQNAQRGLELATRGDSGANARAPEASKGRLEETRPK